MPFLYVCIRLLLHLWQICKKTTSHMKTSTYQNHAKERPRRPNVLLLNSFGNIFQMLPLSSTNKMEDSRYLRAGNLTRYLHTGNLTNRPRLSTQVNICIKRKWGWGSRSPIELPIVSLPFSNSASGTLDSIMNDISLLTLLIACSDRKQLIFEHIKHHSNYCLIDSNVPL